MSAFCTCSESDESELEVMSPSARFRDMPFLPQRLKVDLERRVAPDTELWASASDSASVASSNAPSLSPACQALNFQAGGVHLGRPVFDYRHTVETNGGSGSRQFIAAHAASPLPAAADMHSGWLDDNKVEHYVCPIESAFGMLSADNSTDQRSQGRRAAQARKLEKFFGTKVQSTSICTKSEKQDRENRCTIGR